VNNVRLILLCYFGVGFWLVTPAYAQKSQVVATVNGSPISLNVVHRFLDRSFRSLPELSNRSQRDASVLQIGIEHCVKREIVLQHLRSGKFKTSEEEIDIKLEELSARLQLTEQKIDDFLAKVQLSELELRREVEWQSSWKKYVSKYVTTDHLKKQFDEKRKYFDGTKYHVAQILWKQSDDATMAKALHVRQQLLDKDIDWATAVKEHSRSASAKNGGDLGWIEYSGPMPRGFTQAAFKLEPEQISQPHVSKYGTHLIRCIETIPGTKTFEQVAMELRELETNRLFELVAARYRSQASIDVKLFATESRDSKPPTGGLEIIDNGG
jgi:parvulin-like peptidyl-prolyl isomerase